MATPEGRKSQELKLSKFMSAFNIADHLPPVGQKKMKIMKEYFLGLRLTHSEFHRLGAMSRKSGKSKSEVVRELLEQGFVRERIRREHIEIIRKLIGEATNLNQLAKRANTFGYSAAAKDVSKLADRISGIVKMIKDDG